MEEETKEKDEGLLSVNVQQPLRFEIKGKGVVINPGDPGWVDRSKPEEQEPEDGSTM